MYICVFTVPIYDINVNKTLLLKTDGKLSTLDRTEPNKIWKF